MQRLVLSFITILVLIYSFGCTSVSVQNWSDFIHENVTFILVAEEDMKVSDISEEEYSNYLSEFSSAPIQQLASIQGDFPASLALTALALYPATSTESHFLWISEFKNGNFDKLASQFYEPFTQNNYQFYGYTIHRLIINKSDLFAAKLGKWLILSKSSVVIENALRTSLGLLNSMDFSSEPTAGSVILNTAALDHWAEQFATIESRPSILNVFQGTKPVRLDFSTSTESHDNIQINGKLELELSSHSVLTDAFTFENQPIRLDRHIGSNAAGFSIFRLPPARVPAEPTDNQKSPLDSLLMADMGLYQQIAATLDNEFAFVAFPESGLLNNGEFLFLRTVKDKNALTGILNRLSDDEKIIKVQDSYHLNSSVASELIGSELSTFRDFYLSFSGNVAVIGKRRGLVESVNADRIRRRVIYYDETYSNIRRQMPEELSGFTWLATPKFLEFVQPYLKAGNHIGNIVGRFDIMTITMAKQNDAVDLAINTYSHDGSVQPYEELWVMPLPNVNLTAAPVLGDLVGSSINEIVFSTEDGMVYALASDGTITTQATTNGLKPIGGPVLYDWYGNGQLVIMLPAGNKIFAWNTNGELLPKFPLELEANITSPILVGDILRNGVPEIVVATEDRKIHVIDGRGENVNGWPQNTNATVTSKPAFSDFEGSLSIWVFSENALHGWLRNGTPRPEFPQFINAQFTGSPVFHENQILGSAADGYLYSIGHTPFFADTSSATDTLSEIKINNLYVAGSELTAVSIANNVLLRNDDGFFREDLFVTQSLNGSLFMYNKNGDLRFTQTLGQPASPTFIPQVIDIDGDRNMDVVALAEFGRLYAWKILTDERLYGIPTSGMRYPIFTDLNRDGQLELIAQTREGLRTWTINKITD